MRATTRHALGVGGALILGGAAHAEFVGLDTVSKPNEFGILVCNVYAVFDDADDDMIGVYGDENVQQLTVSVIGGTFFQHPLGQDQAPNPALFAVAPTLRHDTYITIGVKSFNPNDPGNPEGQPDDNITWTPNWPGFGPSTLRLTNSAWGVALGQPQGDPFNPDFVAGDGRVLIMQIATEDGSGFEGTIIVNYFSNGGLHDQIVTFQHVVDDCPWDCADGDGVVGILDWLALLAQWGGSGTSCDLGEPGVGILDFLELAAHWGPCP